MQIELDVAPGLEEICEQEVKTIFPFLDIVTYPAAIQFEFHDDPKRLDQLRSANAAYCLLEFPIPRPKALLGHQHYTRLITAMQSVPGLQDASSLYVDAAGSGSSVMRRIKSELANDFGVRVDNKSGDIWLRIRRSRNGNWQVLIRLTTRPYSLRAWRQCDMPGALNAPTAYAMVVLAQRYRTRTSANVLNLMSGSGTILIEHAITQVKSNDVLIGIDNKAAALLCASRNIIEAYAKPAISQIQADARSTPMPDNSVDVIYMDLPFGQLVGSHADNQTLYPAILDEATRILNPAGIMIAITHEIRLFDKLVRSQNAWAVVVTQKVSLRGLHPRIYVLKKEVG